jgi:hypothetical protein
LIGTLIVARFKEWRLGLTLAGLALTFPAFQALNFMGGQSAAFLRYFILAVPYGFILIGYILPRVPVQYKRVATSVALVSCILSAGSSAVAMNNSTEWGQWNDIFMRSLITRTPVKAWAAEQKISQYLVDIQEGRDFLVDDFQGYRVMFFTGHPEWFIGTGDSDFAEKLRRPVGNVKYLLVSAPRLEGALNKVNIAYPTLYEYGAPWAELEMDWATGDPLGSEWRLYRVKEF